jgi:hypothetical protein
MTKRLEPDKSAGGRPELAAARENAGRLRFSSQNDALDFARHSAENARRWSQTNAINLAERYKHLQCHVVLRLIDQIRANDADYHLVIFGVPSGWEPHLHDQSRATEAFHEGIAHTHPNWDENAMLGPIGKLVQTPDQWIPSLVRIERPKKRDNIIMQIFAPPATDDIGVELGVGISNRKVGAFETGVSEQGGGGEASFVQSCSKALCYFDGLIEESIWENLSKADLVNFITSIRVSLNQTSVWLGFEKSLNARFKIADMLVCSGDTSLGVTKRIDRHD